MRSADLDLLLRRGVGVFLDVSGAPVFVAAGCIDPREMVDQVWLALADALGADGAQARIEAVGGWRLLVATVQHLSLVVVDDRVAFVLGSGGASVTALSAVGLVDAKTAA